MNEFTKEELVKIWRCINPVLIGDDAYDLKIKLREMIDNYCDHEPSDSHYEQFRWQLCGKCGAQYK